MAGAQIELISSKGRSVETTISDTEGRFEIHATPGNYELKVKVVGMYPRCEMVRIRIHMGSLTEANIDCDSGMR